MERSYMYACGMWELMSQTLNRKVFMDVIVSERSDVVCGQFCRSVVLTSKCRVYLLHTFIPIEDYNLSRKRLLVTVR
jgi:hypothetical protein